MRHRHVCANPGSRSWAGATPNLLNVAAARAKRMLYVVGNRAEWQTAGVFAAAAETLESRSGPDWLRPHRMEAAQ